MDLHTRSRDVSHTPTRGSTQGLWARMRAPLVAAASVLVLLAGVVYVIAPPDASVQWEVSELAEGVVPDYEVDVMPEYSLASATTVERRRWRQVFYGKIESRGVPVSRAVLKIRGVGKKTRRQEATVRIGKKKTFRSVVRMRPGKYRVVMTLKAGNRTRTVRTTRMLRNNRAYFVRVQVRESGIVTFLPVTSY